MIIIPAIDLKDGKVVRLLKGDFNTVQQVAEDPVTTAQLFDRFYTVETGQGSTGLGLSIARLLTERMGGRIQADYRAETLYITVSFPEP